MCNASNHPKHCRCGWGPPRDGGAWRPGSAPLGAIYSQGYATFVIPNATCRYCSAAVFFYQSPNGGRLFFDELGPPWPKHYCNFSAHLDLPIPEDMRIRPPIVALERATYPWEKDRWKPLLKSELLPDIESRHCYKLSGLVEADAIDLFAAQEAKTIQLFIRTSSISQDMMFFIRDRVRGEYELSGIRVDISEEAEAINYVGYTSRDVAVAQSISK